MNFRGGGSRSSAFLQGAAGGRHAGRSSRSAGGGVHRHPPQRGGGARGRRGRGPRGSGGGGPRPRQEGDTVNDFIKEIGVEPSTDTMTIAIEGCCHGELDAIYERLQAYEAEKNRKIDLLICCGDFQSIRNLADFHSIAVPPKYRALGSFYRYFSGEKTAPILTLFVGGNHEASQPLQELHYGGWVANKIYYMGAAGVVRIRGLRIGGISGIYKPHDYEMGRFERPPFDQSTVRSTYHVRNIDTYRMKCLQNSKKPPIDIMISHDWPQGVEQYGDVRALLKRKPFFRQEVEQNCLGSPSNNEILHTLRPRYWFAAHLHTQFSAVVSYNDESENGTAPDSNTNTTSFTGTEGTSSCSTFDLTAQMTQFLSLDKCLPRRGYLSVLHIPAEKSSNRLEYDLEWLTVLRETSHLENPRRSRTVLPESIVSISEDQVQLTKQQLGGCLEIPESSFVQTVPAHQGLPFPVPPVLPDPLPMMGNPQTDQLLSMLGLNHTITVPYSPSASTESSLLKGDSDALDAKLEDFADENELMIEDTEDADCKEDDENELDIDSQDTIGGCIAKKRPRDDEN